MTCDLLMLFSFMFLCNLIWSYQGSVAYYIRLAFILDSIMQNPRKEVNAVLKQEAAYFGDIVILPFLDRYELVVLKTIAICEYGVSSFSISS